jgi:pimeloyl-ACP methyl ester carboxylesterase
MALDNLVLLHGALGGSEQLAPLATALALRFRVHLLDFEGHAMRPARQRPFRTDYFVENVLELLDAQRIEKAHIFGYSMGGYVAVCLAIRHPGRVGAIATLGTKFRWDRETAAREAGRLDPAVIRAKVPAFAEALAARHERAGGWEAVLARTADFLRDLGDHPALTDAALARVDHPVRVIVGDRDNRVSRDESDGVVRALPRGSMTVLDETPHPIERVSVDAIEGTLVPFFEEFA